MRIAPDPVAVALAAAAQRLRQSGTGFFAGAEHLGAVDLSGADWYDRYTGAVTQLGNDWHSPDGALVDARAAVAQLCDDSRAVRALVAIDGATDTKLRGYDYIGQVFYNLPADLTPELARMALDRAAQAGRIIANAVADAAHAVAAIAQGAVTPTARRS